jgi:hypothetical protein
MGRVLHCPPPLQSHCTPWWALTVRERDAAAGRADNAVGGLRRALSELRGRSANEEGSTNITFLFGWVQALTSLTAVRKDN